MTIEDLQLGSNAPIDFTRMLVYADYLEDNGVTNQAAAWRWLGAHRKEPEFFNKEKWWWHGATGHFVVRYMEVDNKHVIPDRVLHFLSLGTNIKELYGCCIYAENVSCTIPFLDFVQAFQEAVKNGWDYNEEESASEGEKMPAAGV